MSAGSILAVTRDQFRHTLLCALLLVAYISSSHAGDYFKGKEIYTIHCLGCHGNNGQGQLAGAPNFTRGHSLMKPDARLFDTIFNGQRAMPAYQGMLDNEDIYNVIAYIRNFH